MFKSRQNNFRKFLIAAIFCFPLILNAQNIKLKGDGMVQKFVSQVSGHPIDSLLERIDQGASKKFIINVKPSSGNTDYFELSDHKGKVSVKGNNTVSVAMGIGWYLRHFMGIDISWGNMHPKIPDSLKPVGRTVRHSTKAMERYYLNYCTLSYSMAFWDWPRWQEEIDWMALHGINLCLTTVGTDMVWYKTLRRLGYTDEAARNFIAGPAFQAWWLMNNLEGWGGPVSHQWLAHSEKLQRLIMNRMHELGIRPVLPGFSGMLPHDASQRLGVKIKEPGLWCGFPRPAFLQPTDPKFASIASVYYQEQKKLFGAADYYSMDPFHEGGNVEGVNLAVAGQAILKAMRQCSPKAKWVIQGWQANPRQAMLNALDKGAVTVLDLASDNIPQWGDPTYKGSRKDGYNGHDWLFCILQNFGGNEGLFGRFDAVASGYDRALHSPYASSLKGIGLTMEGIENTPMMYLLVCEMPWLEHPINRTEWVDNYVMARYGVAPDKLKECWQILASTILNSPRSPQRGTSESIFCARPSDHVWQVSTWANRQDYYNPADVIRAASLMVDVSHDKRLQGNNNFIHDLIDVVRQAVAELGRESYSLMQKALKQHDSNAFNTHSAEFLSLLLTQDSLLSTRTEWMLGPRIEKARKLGTNPEEKALYEWNLCTLISVWGNRESSESLHDYSHREWGGMLSDFYYPRWKAWIDQQKNMLEGKPSDEIDFFSTLNSQLNYLL